MNSKTKAFLLLLVAALVLAAPLAAQAQTPNALVLTKRKSKRLQKLFLVGDKITFRLQNRQYFETGVITEIAPNGFFTNGRLVATDSLLIVSETGRGLKLALGLASAAAGGFILFSNTFRGFWIFPVGSALLGTGLIQAGIYGTRLALHNRYNVTRKWRIDAREVDKDY
ncbi:MAG: hypothetical protein MUD08_05405 [Cytophagales bacterium]|jgi:hypothetical protein|nr:hypothetical protein [Cytophagales bacterium]